MAAETQGPASGATPEKRQRGLHRLTPLQVKNAAAGTHEDGGGLRLVVKPNGTRSWVVRITTGGRRREIGIGSAKEVTLADARAKATELRLAARSGEAVQTAREVRATPAAPVAAGSVTLREAFARYFDEKRESLTNAKARAQWPATLERYVFPALGDRDVAGIKTRDVAEVLKPLWREKPEQAKRVQLRLRQTFEWAIAMEFREAANPCSGIKLILGPRDTRVTHQRALPFTLVPEFVAKLRLRSGLLASRLALEWTVLTAARNAEARLASWDEIDLEAATWTVPAERTKMKKEHVVPLAPRCLEILAEARTIRPDGGRVFPGQKSGVPLSENTLNMLVKDLGYGHLGVVHGFRSSFRDWAGEVAKARREVAEACLAHAIGNEVEQAYLRSTFLAERRELMARWAAFCGYAAAV